MPDTLHTHADIRVAEILESARRAFVEKGFDGASMQDLARFAGMSVGNFYRYFPSKDALVGAMIARDMEEKQAVFDALRAAPDPMAAIRASIREHIGPDHCREDGRLWAEMTAAAQRKPEIGRIVAEMMAMFEDRVIGIFAQISGLTEDEARRRHAAEARLILLLIKGVNMHSASPNDEDGQLTAIVLQTIDGILDKIAGVDAPAQKG